VVIATVFLTIIGLAAGFVLGERRNSGAQQDPTTTGPTAAQPAPASPGSEAQCPPEAGEMAASIGRPADLRQVMKVVTDNGTAVWICSDGKGGYYYQSKTGGLEAELVQGVNGLFLYEVDQVDTDHYLAEDHERNRFEVTARRLKIDFAKEGKPDQVNRVVTVE
jgi:hypothetical protein